MRPGFRPCPLRAVCGANANGSISFLFRAVVGFANIVFDNFGVLDLCATLAQGFAVGNRDLVIVGMDFTEGKKTVAVSAIVNKGRLQRGFYSRHFGEIDVTLDLFFGRCLDVVFF